MGFEIPVGGALIAIVAKVWLMSRAMLGGRQPHDHLSIANQSTGTTHPNPLNSNLIITFTNRSEWIFITI
jgi:hypothetical protein